MDLDKSVGSIVGRGAGVERDGERDGLNYLNEDARSATRNE